MEKCHQYDVIYLSPNAASWEPSNTEWAEKEMEFIDHQGEVIPRSCDHYKNATLFYPMDLIEVSTVEAFVVSHDMYGSSVDETVACAYCCDISELDTDNTRPENWSMVEDPIIYHISSIDAKHDTDII